MRYARDLSGLVFGFLTVISRADNRNNRVLWNCECKCGAEMTFRGDALKNGKVKSCGCASSDLRRTSHSGEKHYRWNGGRIKTQNGYVKLHRPHHPNAKRNYVFEHVYVMSENIGRPIKKKETVGWVTR